MSIVPEESCEVGRKHQLLSGTESQKQSVESTEILTSPLLGEIYLGTKVTSTGSSFLESNPTTTYILESLEVLILCLKCTYRTRILLNICSMSL